MWCDGSIESLFDENTAFASARSGRSDSIAWLAVLLTICLGRHDCINAYLRTPIARPAESTWRPSKSLLAQFCMMRWAAIVSGWLRGDCDGQVVMEKAD
jgi:hypothetical protein